VYRVEVIDREVVGLITLITEFSLDADDFITATGEWIIEYKVPKDLDLGYYAFVMLEAEEDIRDKVSPPNKIVEDTFSLAFEAIPAYLSVPAIYVKNPVIKAYRWGWLVLPELPYQLVYFTAKYPDGTDVTEGIARIVIVDPLEVEYTIWAEYDPEDERFEAMFEFPRIEYVVIGEYEVMLDRFELDDPWNNEGPRFRRTTSFKLVEIRIIDIVVDVGSTHFRGERAEFFISTSIEGEPVDAVVEAVLYGPDGLEVSLSVERVALGLFKAIYDIPVDAPLATYSVLISATYETPTLIAKGRGLRSFYLSPTLAESNARLISIEEGIGIVQTDIGTTLLRLDEIDAKIVDIDEDTARIETAIGEISVKLDDIEARIIDVITTAEGEIIEEIDTAEGGIIARVDTAVGEILTPLADLDAKITKIDGDIATVSTVLGDVKVSVEDLHPVVTDIKEGVATVNTTLGELHGKVDEISGNIAEVIIPGIGEISASISKEVLPRLEGIPPLIEAISPVVTYVLIVLVIALIAMIASLLSAIWIRKRLPAPK